MRTVCAPNISAAPSMRPASAIRIRCGLHVGEHACDTVEQLIRGTEGAGASGKHMLHAPGKASLRRVTVGAELDDERLCRRQQRLRGARRRRCRRSLHGRLCRVGRSERSRKFLETFREFRRQRPPLPGVVRDATPWCKGWRGKPAIGESFAGHPT